jgi:hypothetical protein
VSVIRGNHKEAAQVLVFCCTTGHKTQGYGPYVTMLDARGKRFAEHVTHVGLTENWKLSALSTVKNMYNQPPPGDGLWHGEGVLRYTPREVKAESWEWSRPALTDGWPMLNVPQHKGTPP